MTAVVCNPDKIRVKDSNLEVVKADVADSANLVKLSKGKDNLVVDAEGKSTISVEDYAVAIVDELEQSKHHQERFTIEY